MDRLPTDILRHVLINNVGPSTFVSVRRVNRAWADACADESLLESVARYVDGLTRTQFRGLLRLTSAQARAYTHTTKRIRTAHGMRECFLYAPATVRRALRDLRGIDGLKTRAPILVYDHHNHCTVPCPHKRANHEEDLHKRKMVRLAFACMRHLPPECTSLERRQVWQRERETLIAC